MSKGRHKCSWLGRAKSNDFDIQNLRTAFFLKSPTFKVYLYLEKEGGSSSKEEEEGQKENSQREAN